MANLSVLKRKRKRRVTGRNRQYRKFKRTGKRGHLKVFRAHRRALRRLRKLIAKVRRENRPSPNFSYSEFDCHDGRKVPRQSYVAVDHLCQNYLEPLRAKFGAVHITSGYRPSDYNRRIGGAIYSQHIYDLGGRNYKSVAADIVCRTGTPDQWGAFLDARGAGGIGIYPGSGFTHCDNRQLAGNATARWRG